MTAAFPAPVTPIQILDWSTLATMLAWVRVAALGIPVEPLGILQHGHIPGRNFYCRLCGAFNRIKQFEEDLWMRDVFFQRQLFFQTEDGMKDDFFDGCFFDHVVKIWSKQIQSDDGCYLRIIQTVDEFLA